MQSLVSIIIPTYNRAHLIAMTLESVQAQSYSHWECIIVDDGSTDATDKVVAEFCKKDARFKYHTRPSEKQKGANACRNHGVQVSNGDFIQLLDSDDILEEFCLLERVELFSKNADFDLLIRDTGLLIESEKQDKSINLDTMDGMDRETYLRMFLRYELPWHTSSALYKRKLFEKCSFDENLQRFQDVSFNIKVLSSFTEMKILRNFKIDSWYRVEDQIQIKKELLKVVIKSLVKFNKIHADLTKNILYKRDLKKFNVKIFNRHFLHKISENRKEILQLVFSYVKGNIFSNKEKRYLMGCFFLYSTGIINIKGIGMYRFIKGYNKTLNLD